MNKNEESNKVSLSSWNYGSFFPLNPYYLPRPSSLKCKKNETNNLNTQKISKLTNDEDLLNIPYEQYINRDRYLHIEFIRKLTEQRIKSQRMVKLNGKTFIVWKNKKNEKKRKEDKIKQILEELKNQKEQNQNEQNQNESPKTFKDWKKEKILLKKKEEKKRLKSEKNKKAENDKINKERRERMILWEKNKAELIKNKKMIERIIKKEKKIEDEKNNKEKKEKNKQIFIQWLKNKSNIKKINKHKDDSIDQNKKFKYGRIKKEEIIGPFHFGKQLKEVQNSFYKNLNKTNKSQIIKRSNSSKK